MNTQRHNIPQKRNLLLCALLFLVNAVVLFALPWLTQSTLWLTCWLLLDVIFIRLNNLHWHVTHEAVHGLLVKPRWLNEGLGVMLGGLLLSSFSIARYGHLNHHRNNRYADTQEVYYDKNQPNRLYYYFEILGGFFILYEFLLIALAFAPISWAKRILQRKIDARQDRYDLKMYVELQQVLDNKRMISNVRKEAFLLLVILVGSLYCYAGHWLLWLLYFWVRAFFISYLNNMPHYKNSIQTDINAADNAYLPKPLALWYLNFNYHRVHHTYPKAPWTELPKLFQQDQQRFDCHYVKGYLKQLKGPVYFENIIESQI